MTTLFPPPRGRVEFFVDGRSRPAGSKSGFRMETGRIVMAPASKYVKAWMRKARIEAIDAMDGDAPIEGPVHLHCEFRMGRPLKHFRGNKADNPLRPDAPTWHTTTPDLTKVVRAIEDALKGIVWPDDCAVVRQTNEKRYCRAGETEGVRVLVVAVDES